MSRTVASDICRVGVQFGGGRLDFELPADLSVAEVIPSIVDHVAASAAASTQWQEAPADWQLSRIDGRALSPRTLLRDNGIHDGDILWLSRVRAVVQPPPADDAIAEISSSLDAMPRWTLAATHVAVSIVTLCCTGLVGYALLRSPSTGSPVIAGLLAAVALTAAVTYGRVYRETLTAVTLGTCAAASAGVAAYLVVPGSATAPKLMLASAVSATMSVLTARYVDAGTAVFSGVASVGFLSAAAGCVYLVAPVGAAATGAVLAAAAAGFLVATPRLAIWVGRVPVPRLTAPSVCEDGLGVARHAGRAHAIVTGLVCGFSAAAVLGAYLAVHGKGSDGAVFAAVVGATLAFRAGTHVDLVQAAALLASGITCFATVFVWAVGTWPQFAHWIALGAAGIAGASTASLSGAMTSSPLKRRCVELAEYAALAAVIPLACLVCGVFGAVRGLHLS